MDLPKIHSISKKLLVALVGGFLLLFLLFHMTANLFILRHDGGQWYSDFCHFMGTNWVVKIFEIILLGVIALHILLTMWLAVTNRMARPVRYHQPSRSKTHPGSKLMVWTGILIFVCLIIHFCDFYFVKIGVVKGQYMVKTEKLQGEELMNFVGYAQQYGLTPEEFVNELDKNPITSPEDQIYLNELHDKLAVIKIIENAATENKFSDDRTVIHRLSHDDCETLQRVMPESEPEPDFYYMTREKFSHLHIVIGYLVFFLVLFFHLMHAFPSAFQTLGLNNYKYNPIIEALGKIYTWIIVLGFAAVPILVYLGL